VINVAWDDITKEYLPWLSRRTGKTYRLLSEAEWEHAARAGTTTPYYTGATVTPDQANFANVYLKTTEVGSFQPNSFGLHDMDGNVWEWVQDCYEDSYVLTPVDGSAATFGRCNIWRVLRGGSWLSVQ
jgi:formylglycine-generating enzyme required for sulfatase activity